jgi:hypothetical protein
MIGYSGCGNYPPAERDHLRYWVSPDNTTVWVAASYEYRGCTGFLAWVGNLLVFDAHGHETFIVRAASFSRSCSSALP